MQARLLEFIRLLRSHELAISPAEAIDALRAAELLGWGDRSRLLAALCATLARSAHDEVVLRDCFESFFGQELQAFDAQREAAEAPASGEGTQAEAPPAPEPGTPASGRGDASGAGDGALLAMARPLSPALGELLDGTLLPALIENDRALLNRRLRSAARKAGLDGIRLFTQKGQFARRMLDAIGEAPLRRAVQELDAAADPHVEILRSYRDLLRREVRDYIDRDYLLRRRGEDRRAGDDILKQTRMAAIEQRYLDRIEQLVKRLARRLASRHSPRKRRLRKGQLHMAATLRAGMPHDGVLFEPRWRGRRRDRARLLALCDVSGSVSAYARFLLLFLYELQAVLPRMRSFAFSSHLGEISDLFERYPPRQAIELANWRYGGATDYGASLRTFADLALHDIHRDTSVIILGDARNNRGEPELSLMQEIHRRSKQLIWLNPEARQAWGTGDSEMHRYATACDLVAECATLAQLERIADRLIRSTR